MWSASPCLGSKGQVHDTTTTAPTHPHLQLRAEHSRLVLVTIEPVLGTNV